MPLPEKAGLMHPAHAAAAPLQPPDGTLQAFHIIQTRARVNHLSQTHEAPLLKRTPCPVVSHVSRLREGSSALTKGGDAFGRQPIDRVVLRALD